MKSPIFTGSSVAIITPFKNGKVDYTRFADLIERQIIAGTSAITVCGTTGESATLTKEEHSKIVDFCVNYVSGRVKVIAGTGSNCTQAALYLSQEAEASGVDAVMLVTPYYNKTTQTGLITHYTHIADQIHIPIIIYDVPSRTGISIAPDTFAILAQHSNINGLKDATGNLSHTAMVLSKCGDALNIWSGNDDIIVPMMSLGSKGVISVAANIIPKTIVEITDACLNGNFQHGASLQLFLADFISALFSEVNPIPVKAAMQKMNLDTGEIRLPLCNIGETNLQKLIASMKNIGITI